MTQEQEIKSLIKGIFDSNTYQELINSCSYIHQNTNKDNLLKLPHNDLKDNIKEYYLSFDIYGFNHTYNYLFDCKKMTFVQFYLTKSTIVNNVILTREEEEQKAFDLMKILF